MFRMDMLGAGLGHTTSLHDLGLEVGHHAHHAHHHHTHHHHEQLHPHQPLPPHRPLSPLHSAHSVDSSFSPSSHLPSSTVKIKPGKYPAFFLFVCLLTLSSLLLLISIPFNVSPQV
jgi:hypothetical protein